MAKRKPNAIDRRIGRRIRQRRADWHISAATLAARLGISNQQLLKYETAQNRIPASMLWEVSEQLEVNIAWFFDNRDAL